MEIEKGVAQGEQDVVHQSGNLQRGCAVGIAGEGAVQIEAIDRRSAAGGPHGRQIDRRSKDQSSRDRARIEIANHLTEDDRPFVLVAMIAALEDHRRPVAIFDYGEGDPDHPPGVIVRRQREQEEADLLSVLLEIYRAVRSLPALRRRVLVCASALIGTHSVLSFLRVWRRRVIRRLEDLDRLRDNPAEAARDEAGVDQRHGLDRIVHVGVERGVLARREALQVRHDRAEGVRHALADQGNLGPLAALDDHLKLFGNGLKIVDEIAEFEMRATANALHAQCRRDMFGSEIIRMIERETAARGAPEVEDNAAAGVFQIRVARMRRRLCVDAQRLAENGAYPVEIMDRVKRNLDRLKPGDERPQFPGHIDRQPNFKLDHLAEEPSAYRVTDRQHRGREAELKIRCCDNLAGVQSGDDGASPGETGAERLLDQGDAPTRQALDGRKNRVRRQGKVEYSLRTGGFYRCLQALVHSRHAEFRRQSARFAVIEIEYPCDRQADLTVSRQMSVANNSAGADDRDWPRPGRPRPSLLKLNHHLSGFYSLPSDAAAARLGKI